MNTTVRFLDVSRVSVFQFFNYISIHISFKLGHPVVFCCLLHLILGFSQHTAYSVNHALMYD